MLAEAEKVYVTILNERPNHFDALHLLGVLRHQQGNSAEAVRLIKAGAGARRSVGTGVMGGMLAATALAIFFIPMFYKVITERKLREPRGFCGRRPSVTAAARPRQVRHFRYN